MRGAKSESPYPLFQRGNSKGRNVGVWTAAGGSRRTQCRGYFCATRPKPLHPAIPGLLGSPRESFARAAHRCADQIRQSRTAWRTTSSRCSPNGGSCRSS
ncbi:hypothetical protein [Lysobacter gummosus]|uniref:hypothetical protein n=1 Tax=Lysobacter gummosus TaxID=262324 RepID=UPI003641BFEF